MGKAWNQRLVDEQYLMAQGIWEGKSASVPWEFGRFALAGVGFANSYVVCILVTNSAGSVDLMFVNIDPPSAETFHHF